MRYDRLEHKFVDDIPERLEPGFLYVSMRYATALHLCCCGCGREVVTPFSPAQWKLTFDGEAVSLNPSIGSWSLPCRSHYVIHNGRVIGAPSWTDSEIEYGQMRDKQARRAHYGTKSAPQRPLQRPEVAQPQVRKGWLGWLVDLFKDRW
ncbi:MAG: hypothetical protein HIU82_16065 [Proteobacteria bacterium]|nr:hypothetical protein [Pseudomonadota bacterium]